MIAKIVFPGYLMVLLAFDLYFIFLCSGIASKIELSSKLPAEFCNLRWIRWTIRSIGNSLLIMSKSIGSSNCLNKSRFSIKKTDERFSKKTQTSGLTEILTDFLQNHLGQPKRGQSNYFIFIYFAISYHCNRLSFCNLV